MGLAHRLPAQQIDLSLHATAVPDSFEVRATATSGIFMAVPNATFSLRWEVAAGGVAQNSDIRRACDGFSLSNQTGTIDIADHRYFTLVLFGDRPLGPECAIGPEGRTIAGIRIRQLSGCRHVQLVQNAYTQLNNLNYYFSIGGVPVTGAITSAPIPGGRADPAYHRRSFPRRPVPSLCAASAPWTWQ